MTTLQLDAKLELGPLALDLHLVTRARRVVVDGPSGSGKSTCLRILAGLEPAAQGKLVIDGNVWMDSAARVHVPAWQRRVGWVPQDALLFPHRRVRANLAYAAPDDAALHDVARLLRVEPLLDRLPRNLSGGERQRVALGRALLARPRLLLLDEPFAALDAPLRTELAAALAEHCTEHDLAVVLVTHDTAAAEALDGEHWTLSGGRIAPR
jgi:molybdate transport system ATP-binding protein